MKQKHIVKYVLHLYDNDSIAVKLKFVEGADVVDGVGGYSKRGSKWGGVVIKESLQKHVEIREKEKLLVGVKE